MKSKANALRRFLEEIAGRSGDHACLFIMQSVEDMCRPVLSVVFRIESEDVQGVM